ncbi:MAG: hypothetical protein LIP16_13275 [Clostridium sp.]|nr:hypothetical protein [Clostridium sp.]
MDEFKVKLGPVRDAASQNSRMSDDLSRIRDELYSVKNSLRFKIAQRERIERRLSQQGEAVEQEQRKMKNLASSLTDIADMYERTESALCGLEMPEQESGAADMGAADFPWMEFISGLVFNPIISGLFRPGRQPEKFFPEVWTEVKSETTIGLIDCLVATEKGREFKEKADDWFDSHSKKIPGYKGEYDTATKTWKHTDLDDDEAVKKFDKDHKNKGIDTSVKIVGIEGTAAKALWRADASAGDEKGTHANASASFFKAEACAEAYGGLYQTDPVTGEKKLKPSVGAKVGASFSVFTAEEEAQLGSDMLGVYAKSTQTLGRVGAEGEATLGFYDANGKFNPSAYGEVKAEAIAGEITGAVGGKILGTDVGVKGSLNYGIGAHASAGFKDGKLSLDVGATLGVGGSVSLEIDVSGTVNAVCDGAKAAWNGIKGLWR